MSALIKPHALRKGDTIGVISPCIAFNEAYLKDILDGITGKGFRYKLGKNLLSDTYGYAASIAERAEDFNEMVLDPDVRMILFNGGEVSNEILPEIDFDAVKKKPKIICSFSDGTTLVESVHAKTGLVTFYSGSLNIFSWNSAYNYRSFEQQMIYGCTSYEKASEWQIIRPGDFAGEIAAGYLWNFDLLQRSDYYCLPDEPYILFIEDHESFSPPAMVAKFLFDMVQKGAFAHATGLVFGHYSTKPEKQKELFPILQRVGEQFNIPVIYTDDFGHGDYASILPIGIRAKYDSAENRFTFLESGVVTE